MNTNTKLAFSENYGSLLFDGLEGDFSTDNYSGNFIALEDCGRDELLSLLKSNPYYVEDAIQSYFNDWFTDVNWGKFNGDYDGLIRSTLDDNSGGVNASNFKFYFNK